MTYQEFADKYLSGEVKKRFIKNTGQYFLTLDADLEDKSRFIGCAFTWESSPEGHNYWSKVKANIYKDITFYMTKHSWVFWGCYDKDGKDNKPYGLFWTRKEAREEAERELKIKKYIVTEV